MYYVTYQNKAAGFIGLLGSFENRADAERRMEESKITLKPGQQYVLHISTPIKEWHTPEKKYAAVFN